jgi:hypothetical protein
MRRRFRSYRPLFDPSASWMSRCTKATHFGRTTKPRRGTAPHGTHPQKGHARRCHRGLENSNKGGPSQPLKSISSSSSQKRQALSSSLDECGHVSVVLGARQTKDRIVSWLSHRARCTGRRNFARIMTSTKRVEASFLGTSPQRHNCVDAILRSSVVLRSFFERRWNERMPLSGLWLGNHVHGRYRGQGKKGGDAKCHRVGD